MMRRHIHQAAFLVVLALLLGACSKPPEATHEAETTPESPSTVASKSAPHNADEETLRRELDRLLSGSEFSSARWGVHVTSLKDGHTVYEHNADKLFTPASNMKLFPTGVGLELLGADYRWRTSIYAATKPDASGTVNGDLVIYGRGAPDLVANPRKDDAENNSLAQLANNLYERGVRRIQGNVVGDESYFRGETLGDGWQWNDVQWYFGAEASALSINNNEFSVNIAPPDKSGTPVVRVTDQTGYVTVDNRMIAGGSERLTLGIQRGLSDNLVRVWGTFPNGSKGYGARLSVHNPALWTAKLLIEILKTRGIAVDGGPQSRNSREPISNRFDPAKNVELAFVLSRPLREIIKDTNKESINLYAELILRTLGRERSAMLPEPEPAGRERGDDEIGLGVIRLWLNRSGVSTNGLAMHDGSGLSRLNLVTPKSFAELLTAIHKTPAAQTFRESLPLSGRDGTLGYRLKEQADRVSAKTGYLSYDAALSGYLTTSSNETFAFSIICNDQTGRGSSGRLIDRIVSLLAADPALPTQKP